MFQTGRYYSVKHTDSVVQKSSSSGGAFSAISDVILDQGGVVVGGGYNFSNDSVEYYICKTKEERDLLKGSKYIQCNSSKIYRQLETEIKEQINTNNSPILVVGTPCQIDGIQSYLQARNIAYDGLIYCDLICHGTPSPGVWKYYINRIRKRITPTYITFKDKTIGWNQPLAFVGNKDKRFSLRGFTLLYFGKLIMRPACHECPFAKTERISDITLGDHWSIRWVDPEFFDKNGVSLVIINTEKGRRLFNQAAEKMIIRLRTEKECLQESLIKPVDKHTHRVKFWKLFRQNKWLAVAIFDALMLIEKFFVKIKHS